MGTNYYLEANPPCKECGRGHEPMHIGKSSAGWCFSLHVLPDRGINDLDDWIALLIKPGARISDEYGRQVTPGQLLDVIVNRGSDDPKPFNPFGYDSVEHFLSLNHATLGPRGLMRHNIGSHCLKHGIGTWDCCPGEFS